MRLPVHHDAHAHRRGGGTPQLWPAPPSQRLLHPSHLVFLSSDQRSRAAASCHSLLIHLSSLGTRSVAEPRFGGLQRPAPSRHAGPNIMTATAVGREGAPGAVACCAITTLAPLRPTPPSCPLTAALVRLPYAIRSSSACPAWGTRSIAEPFFSGLAPARHAGPYVMTATAIGGTGAPGTAPTCPVATLPPPPLPLHLPTLRPVVSSPASCHSLLIHLSSQGASVCCRGPLRQGTVHGSGSRTMHFLDRA